MSTNRKLVFANDHYYHVFNRGVEKRPIFTNVREYAHAFQTLNYYRFKNLRLKFSKYLTLSQQNKTTIAANFSDANKLVDIICYCLMPNHFHLLLKQKVENGISIFLSNFSNSYTKYFNTKHERVGPLLQGPFKAVLVETEEQLLHLNRYIHINPVVSCLIKETELINYSWSSISEYLNPTQNNICNMEEILSNFKTPEKYLEFLKDQISYAKDLEKIKHLLNE